MAKQIDSEASEWTAKATAALDRLSLTPPRDFIAARASLVSALRGEGDAVGAKQVAAARRTPPSAWALNVVAREHAGAMAGYVHAAVRARAAQGETIRNDDGRPFAAARRDIADHEARVLALAKGAMLGAGLPWTPSARRRIAGTLRAVVLAGDDDRARLLAGRLQGDIDAASDFEALAASLGADGSERRREETAPHPAEAARAPRKTADARDAHDTRRREERAAEARREREAKAEEARRARAARAKATELETRARAREEDAKALRHDAVKAEHAAAKARSAAELAEKEASEAREEARAARVALEGT
jgi:hypothetical protein